MGIKGKLRIGILLDSFNVPAWAYAMVERIAHSNYAEIVLIVLNESQNKPWNKNFLSRIFHAWRYLFYNAYLLLENFLFPLNPDAFEIKNIRSLVKHIPVIPVRPVQTAHFDCFSDRDIQKIKHFRTDVLIRLGFRILQGKILQTPLYGVWSYQHADNDVNGGGPAGFWEVIEKKPVTGSVLQMLTEDLDAGIVLYKSYASTDPLSVNRNRNHLYWKSLSFIPRKLEELHKQKDSFIKQHLQTSQNIHLYSNRLYAPPHNLKALQCILSLLFKYINYRCFNKFYFDQWILLFDIRKNISPSLWKYKKMIPPKDRFWADPFIFFKNGLYYIFIEEMDFAKHKGHLSVFTMDEQGTCSTPQKILETPYHLSYPFIFEHRGTYYLVPETLSRKTIQLYQCIEFPHKWKFVKNLIDNISAVDATLIHYRNRWWLFATVVENNGVLPWDELFLFHSKDLFADTWTPHPKNPIVSDVRKARPAGRIFEHHGYLIRPSQDCSKRYGYGIVFNKIVTMNEMEYIEKEVQTMTPDWDKRIKGIHSFDHKNNLTIIDGFIRRRKYF